jgi:electron transfer flavoprotein beta subunit
MNIIVCIKYISKKNIDFKISSFDKCAIEEAIKIKEKNGGKIIAITMGPHQAESILRYSISLGVDKAILLTDVAFSGSDTFATSYVLSSVIKKIGNYSIVICGRESYDVGTGQVGPEIAEMLNIPHISYVKNIKFIDDNIINIEREMEDGIDLLESSIPILLTVCDDINVPRIPSLKRSIFAKKVTIDIFDAFAIGVDINKTGIKGSPTKIVKSFYDTKNTIINCDCKKIKNVDEIIDLFVEKLFTMNLLKETYENA